MLNDEQRIAYLEIENTQLRSEATRLRKALMENSRHAKQIERAYSAAMLLAVHHIGYGETSRREAMRVLSLSQRQWENGIALLKIARVHNGLRFLTHDLPTLEAKLANARKWALETPAAFKARLPRRAH